MRTLITAALPYANASLHLGHLAGVYLPADVYARFCRQRGDELLFVCGSDEHGVAITLSAEAAGRTPQEQVDIYHREHQELFKRFKIDFDHYSRTTTAQHAELTKQFFEQLLRNEFIEPRESEQLYSEEEQRFLADRYVIGTCPKCQYEAARGDECPRCGGSFESTDLLEPRSKISGSKLTLRPTTNWYLLLDKLAPKVQAWLKTRKWKPNVQSFSEHYAEELRPRAITRDLSWGIPVPLEEAAGKVFYVWFDAPIGYISASMEWAEKLGEGERWKDFWLSPQTHMVQFLGKDNIPFHALFFPAMCMGQDLPLKVVDDLPANEFYQLEGRKFSKSEGWTIDPEELLRNFTVDQVRYMLAASAPETSDSAFTWDEFLQRCNGDLLGKFGNLAQRVLAFAQKACEGEIPDAPDLQAADIEFLHRCERLAEQIYSAYSNYKLRQVTALLMELANEGNGYFDFRKPWKALKLREQPLVDTTIACCLECLKLLALCTSPIMPDTAQRLWEQLGQPGKLADYPWRVVLERPLEAGDPLPEPEHLFAKVEAELIDYFKDSLKNRLDELEARERGSMGDAAVAEPVTYSAVKEQIDFKAFGAVDIRAGKILDCQPVKGSKKLLKVTVDMGFEQRQIVSGIAQHYQPEELLGMTVAVVANLAPAKIMGVESNGMILAADVAGGGVRVVEVATAPGSVIC